MARLLVFFVVVFLLTGVLAQVPYVGAAFRIPFLGFWFTAILLSAVFARLGTAAVDLRSRRSLERQLGAVDTPHHKGKLASLLLSQGRPRKALPLFEEAAAGDPGSLEWRYRLGQARLLSGGAPEQVVADLDAVLARDEEYAFGAAMLLSARAAWRQGDTGSALRRVERYERNHGPSPDSAILRGRLLRAEGRRQEADAAFDEVPVLLRTIPGHAASRSRMPRLRAFLGRHFG